MADKVVESIAKAGQRMCSASFSDVHSSVVILQVSVCRCARVCLHMSADSG